MSNSQNFKRHNNVQFAFAFVRQEQNLAVQQRTFRKENRNVCPGDVRSVYWHDRCVLTPEDHSYI